MATTIGTPETPLRRTDTEFGVWFMSVSTVCSADQLDGLLSGSAKLPPLERNGYNLSSEAAGTPYIRPTGIVSSIRAKLASLAPPRWIAADGNAFSQSGWASNASPFVQAAQIASRQVPDITDR